MTDITIRLATPADLPACAAIVNDWIDESDWHPRILSRDEIAAQFTPAMLDARTLLVAEDADGILGYLSLDEPERFVRGFYLAPGARCRGVGRLLLDEAKRRCPDRLELGVFAANEHAVRFYEREGFRDVPEGFKRADEVAEGLDEHLMRWVG